MPFVRANDIDIYYETGGPAGARRLLFISGTGGDLRVRPNVFDAPLGKRFQILAYDQRGLGRTAKPTGPYDMTDYADDAAAVLDVLGWGSVPVVGVSFGGMVAQELALRHPDKVRCLVLACTSAGGAGGASYPLHELADLPESERLVKQLELADTRRDAAWRAAHPDRWEALLSAAGNGRSRDAEEPDAAREQKRGAREQLQARAGHDTWDRLERLDLPVLLAGGRYDGIAPPANLEAMASRIRNARLMMFEGGHLFMIQDRAAYPAIIDWLDAIM
jgi:3-oxoadipate enol-lactonase